MIRLAFRLLSAISLAIAVIMAVTDATRSIAISHLEPTPLGAYWLQYSPDTLATVRIWIDAHATWLWDPLLLNLLTIPGFVAFAVLAFLLYAVGYRRPDVSGRLAL